MNNLGFGKYSESSLIWRMCLIQHGYCVCTYRTKIRGFWCEQVLVATDPNGSHAQLMQSVKLSEGCVVFVPGAGTGEGQSHTDQGGQQSTLSSHLHSTAVHTLALHGLLPYRFLPLHLRQMVEGKKRLSMWSPLFTLYMHHSSAMEENREVLPKLVSTPYTTL